MVVYAPDRQYADLADDIQVLFGLSPMTSLWKQLHITNYMRVDRNNVERLTAETLRDNPAKGRVN